MAQTIPFPQRSPAPAPKRPTIKTAQSIKGLPLPASGSVDYFVERAPGLPVISLRITASGVRIWTQHSRINGKQNGSSSGACLRHPWLTPWRSLRAISAASPT